MIGRCVSYHLLVVIGAVAAVDQTARVSGVLLLTQESLLLGTGVCRGGGWEGKDRGDKRKRWKEEGKGGREEVLNSM